MAGKLSRDKMADDPTTRFKSETYFTIMDKLVTQIDDRYNDFRSTVTYFYGIDPSQMSEENKDYFQSLCKIYKHEINLEEAIVEYDTFKDLYALIYESLVSELQL